MASRTSARTRRPRRRPGRSARARRRDRVRRVSATAVLVAGGVTALAGTGAVALNEPTSAPTVSPALVVLARGEVEGTRLQAVGAALVALGLGFHLGQAGRSTPRRPRARTK